MTSYCEPRAAGSLGGYEVPRRRRRRRKRKEFGEHCRKSWPENGSPVALFYWGLHQWWTDWDDTEGKGGRKGGRE